MQVMMLSTQKGSKPPHIYVEFELLVSSFLFILLHCFMKNT